MYLSKYMTLNNYYIQLSVLFTITQEEIAAARTKQYSSTLQNHSGRLRITLKDSEHSGRFKIDLCNHQLITNYGVQLLIVQLELGLEQSPISEQVKASSSSTNMLVVGWQFV